MNELIDVHEKRVTLAIRYRLPGIIWMVLYGLAVFAMAMGGYESGLSGSRRFIAITLSTALACAVVLLLVVTLDRPYQHQSTTQAAMFDLQESMRR